MGQGNATMNAEESEREDDNLSKYVPWILRCIIAVVAIFILFILKRTAARTDGQPRRCLGMRLIYPVNFLDSGENRLTHVLIFVSLIDDITGLVFGTYKTDFWPNAPVQVKVLKVIFFCLLLGFVRYPLFACLSLQRFSGFLLGAVCQLLLLAVDVWWAYDHLADNSNTTAQSVRILARLPGFVAAMTVFASFVAKAVRAFMVIRNVQLPRVNDNRFVGRHLGLARSSDIALPSFMQYVKNLLRSSDPKSKNGCTNKTSLKATLLRQLRKGIRVIYQPVSGFRYPLPVLIAIAVPIVIIWQAILIPLRTLVASVENYEAIADVLTGEDGSQMSQLMALVVTMFKLGEKVKYIKGSAYVCLAVGPLITTVTLLCTLKSFQRHSLQVSRGNYAELPERIKSAQPRIILSAASRYIGYQVAFAIGGFVVQFICVALVCLSVAAALAVNKKEAREIFLMALDFIWPWLLFGLAMRYLQQFLVHRFFLQTVDDDNKPRREWENRWKRFAIWSWNVVRSIVRPPRGERVLALQHRRAFFNYQFFMVFMNAAVGVLASVKRFLYCAVYGLWILPRLDVSAMPRTAELLDTGFRSYAAMVILNNVQNNPIMLTFCTLLLHGIATRKNLSEYPPPDSPLAEKSFICSIQQVGNKAKSGSLTRVSTALSRLADLNRGDAKGVNLGNPDVVLSALALENPSASAANETCVSDNDGVADTQGEANRNRSTAIARRATRNRWRLLTFLLANPSLNKYRRPDLRHSLRTPSISC